MPCVRMNNIHPPRPVIHGRTSGPWNRWRASHPCRRIQRTRAGMRTSLVPQGGISPHSLKRERPSTGWISSQAYVDSAPQPESAVGAHNGVGPLGKSDETSQSGSNCRQRSRNSPINYPGNSVRDKGRFPLNQAVRCTRCGACREAVNVSNLEHRQALSRRGPPRLE